MWDERKLRELKQKTICLQSVCLSALQSSTTMSTSKSTAKSSASSKDCKELNCLQSSRFRNANQSRKHARPETLTNPNFSSPSNQCRWAAATMAASKAKCQPKKMSLKFRATPSSHQVSLSNKWILSMLKQCHPQLDTRMTKSKRIKWWLLRKIILLAKIISQKSLSKDKLPKLSKLLNSQVSFANLQLKCLAK